MNASDIVRLLNSNHYAPAELDEVNNICRNYPEFGIAHMLRVRMMEVLGYKKDKELKVAAVYAMDRKKLFQLVIERHGQIKTEPEPEPELEVTPEPVPEPVAEPTGAIQFSDEANDQADVIIEQHAPYAGQEPAGDLLELDEDPEEEPESGSEEIPEQNVEKPGEEPGKEPGTEQNSNNNLIKSFIMDEPGVIRADKKTSLKGDVSLSSIQEHDGFITDTLAKIYVKQGLLAKAIYAYEKLSLKYPEKSAYFAAQIEKIRNINHS